MNDRERFQAIMHYGDFDRGIIQDFQYWKETVDVWHLYGLPKDVDYEGCERFFGFDPMWTQLGCKVLLCPPFESKLLKDEGETVLEQNSDGTITRRGKYMSSIPQHVAHTLVDRESWERHYKWRLDPSCPERIGEDIEESFAANADAVRTWPVRVTCGAMFGVLRNWMGLEGVSYIQYDDPRLFAEMIETIGNCQVGSLERFLPMAKAAGVTFDYGTMWEDMCFAQGPLLSVDAFKEHLVPQYRRISRLLKAYGCDLILLDCDGDVRLLLRHWLESGVNVAFPLEVGTWGVDPIEIRKEFGRDLRLAGGFDKHILARTTDDIAREIDRLAPMVEEGGFIPFCDHRVPPDVPFSNYLFYVKRAKNVWGRGLDSLRPTGDTDTSAKLYDQPYNFRAVLGGNFVPQE